MILRDSSVSLTVIASIIHHSSFIIHPWFSPAAARLVTCSRAWRCAAPGCSHAGPANHVRWVGPGLRAPRGRGSRDGLPPAPLPPPPPPAPRRDPVPCGQLGRLLGGRSLPANAPGQGRGRTWRICQRADGPGSHTPAGPARTARAKRGARAGHAIPGPGGDADLHVICRDLRAP